MLGPQGLGWEADRATGLGLASAGRPVSCRTMGMVVASNYRVRVTLSSSAETPAPGPDEGWIGPDVRACLEVTAAPRCGQAVAGDRDVGFTPCVGLGAAPNTAFFFSDWHLSLPWTFSQSQWSKCWALGHLS